MGQRLVVSIKRNLGDDKSLCKLYYHWSGYTTSALEETLQIINHLNSIENIEKVSDKEIQLDFIRYCESNGGGLNGSDYDFVKNYFPKETFKMEMSRNYGIVSISEKDQKDVQRWSEGDVEIGIDDRKVGFFVDYLIGSTEEDVREEYEDYDLSRVINLKHNIEECSYEEFAEIYDQLMGNEGEKFRNVDGIYYSYIY